MRLAPVMAPLWTVALLTALAGAAVAQQVYPNRPIRLISPNPPGGGTTIMGRLIGQKLAESWGQQVIVDNRPGGNGFIGGEALVKSPPDGHTLMVITSTFVITPSLFPPPYDPVKDIAAVASLARSELVLVVHPSVAATNLREFIALAKLRKGELSYAATSSPTMLATELFIRTAGIEILRVNYKGSSPAITALLTGDVQLVISGIGSLLPLSKSGKVRAIAITSVKRSPLALEIPTAIEQGLKDYTASVWCGMAAPSNMPRPVVEKINTDMRRILADAEVKARLLVQGVEPLPNTPEQFSEMIRLEIAKWAKVVKESGVRIE